MNSLTVDQNERICTLVTQAGQRAKAASHQDFGVYEKGVEDYVTSVDQELDRYLSQGFQALFPTEGLVTEENQASCEAFQVSPERLWLIDPIDGTEEFIHKGDGYAVMVGLLERYQPKAGWVYAPARQILYWGGADWGLFKSVKEAPPEQLRSRCPLPPSDQYCPLLLGHRDQKRFGAAIAEYLPAAQCYSLGSFGLKVLEVIQGKAGLYVYLNGRVKLWDTVGPLAMAAAAGLTCCDLEGNPFGFAPHQVQAQTLIHKQAVILGWPSYVEALLPRLQRAVRQVLKSEQAG
ncbi:MAG: inositol monophosphatase family protein [Cyanobacteria bacterium P01_A01_bin.105]